MYWARGEDHMNIKNVLVNRRLWIMVLGFSLCVAIAWWSGFFARLGGEDALLVERGRVLLVDNTNLSSDPVIDGLYLGRQILEIELISGEFAGQGFRIENTLSRFFNHMAQENMELLFQVSHRDGTVSHIDVFGHSRSNFIYVFIGLFALILLAVGKKKGLYAVVSLVFTLSIVVFFMIPSIIDGRSPVAVAILTAAVTAVFSILLVGDVSKKSASAIGGTVIGVAVAGLVSILAGRFAHISGMHLEHASEIIHQGGRDFVIRLPQLLFAGIIIASLGAVMDVGVTIASSIFEMKEIDSSMTMGQLFKRGMNIGRDIIGTMSNTLILAFAGTSITVMIIIALYELPYLRFINMNLLAVEIIQGVSASIGLVLTVPITAFFAAVLAGEGGAFLFRRKLKKRLRRTDASVDAA